MGLVGRTIEQQRHRAGQELAIPGTQNDPFAAGRRSQRAIPERARHVRLQRMHETDRSAVRNHLGQDLAKHLAGLRRGGNIDS